MIASRLDATAPSFCLFSADYGFSAAETLMPITALLTLTFCLQITGHVHSAD